MIPLSHQKYIEQRLNWWGWSWRLMIIAMQIILAYWLARPNDTFFYQGF